MSCYINGITKLSIKLETKLSIKLESFVNVDNVRFMCL